MKARNNVALLMQVQLRGKGGKMRDRRLRRPKDKRRERVWNDS